MRRFQWLGVAALVLAAGCALAPPTQEMSDARQALQAAREAGAERYTAAGLASVERLIGQAESRLEFGDFRAAREKALAAKQEALHTRDTALALQAAAQAIEAAAAHGALWRDTEDLYTQARAAANRGDDPAAWDLARQARQQADLALNQYYVERARLVIRRYREGSRPSDRHTLDTLAAAEAALARDEGKKAYDLLSALPPGPSTHWPP